MQIKEDSVRGKEEEKEEEGEEEGEKDDDDNDNVYDNDKGKRPKIYE